jgi:phage N-6-adenine-methyltransferase
MIETPETPNVIEPKAAAHMFSGEATGCGSEPENCRWATPPDVFGPLNDEFGFTLDVCAEEWNAKCPEFIPPERDGLAQDWAGTAWMNPPYGREIEKWIRKAYLESQRGVTVVCLVPARTETAWWHDYCLKGEIRFIRGRIHFTDPHGRSGRPRFGSAVVIFRS